MDILTTKDDLAFALVRATAIAEQRSTTPILSAVVIRARVMGGITVIATDKALTYSGEHPATVREPGAVAVNAANLAKVIGALRPGEVRMTLDSTNFRVTIRSGNTTVKLDGLNPDDFPMAPPIKEDRTLTFAAANLRKLIDQVLPSCAPDDNRYGLNGALAEGVSPGVVRFVTTDGNRLAYSECPGTGEPPGRKVLIPRKALAQIRDLIAGHDGDVSIAFGSNALGNVNAAVCRVGTATLHMRMLEADFPEYRQVLPSSYKRQVVLDRREIDAALKRVGIFAADAAHSVRFAFSQDGLVLSARKLDAGDAREELPCELSGENLTAGFNSRFFLDALKVLSGPRIILRLGDALSPCVVTDPDDPAAVLVIMPIRLD